MLKCVDADVCYVATPFVQCFYEYLHVEYLEAIKKIIQQCISIAEFVNGESEQAMMTSQNQFSHSRIKDQDGSNTMLVMLKQRLLYDEIEAEVDHYFDIFVSKLCEIIFTYYKSWAASELLNPSFLFASENAKKYVVQPMRLHMLLKMTRVKLLRRMFNLRSLTTEWMNTVFRESIEFLFDRFECQDLCAIVELEKLLDILKHSHELLSRDLSIDSFSFYCATQDLNFVHQSFARLPVYST